MAGQTSGNEVKICEKCGLPIHEYWAFYADDNNNPIHPPGMCRSNAIGSPQPTLNIAQTLKDRNRKYNPNPDRLFCELELWIVLDRAVEPYLPEDLSLKTRGAIMGLLLKTARAIESGIGGVYVKDTDDDHKGYNKVIAATVLGIPPEEVTE